MRKNSVILFSFNGIIKCFNRIMKNVLAEKANKMRNCVSNEYRETHNSKTFQDVQDDYGLVADTFGVNNRSKALWLSMSEKELMTVPCNGQKMSLELRIHCRLINHWNPWASLELP